MVLAGTTTRPRAANRRLPGGVRRRDLAPGAEVVGAWQLVTVWALLLVTRQPSGGSFAELGLTAVAAVAAGFLHGLLFVKPIAVLGRWTARLSAWPEPVAVAVLVAALSVPPALLVHRWLGTLPEALPGFGSVWAWTALSAVLPLLAGAYLRARPVPARALWARGAVVAGTVVGVVTLASLVMDLPL
ncbi:hypothetical protein ABZW32_20770 [Streptomyces sp. NPDC004667]|uniref:hypothetical protein n=1 Tax=Streptomyces sp. NPDC004667 TaxID=3154285 RepID=UPI0033AA75D1